MSTRHQTSSFYRQAQKGLDKVNMADTSIADQIAFLQVKATLALADAINNAGKQELVSPEPLAPAEPMKLEDIALLCDHGYAICARCGLVPESWSPR